MKKLNERVIEKDGNYIAEVVVLDETTGEKYFVTCRVGNLFYRTFRSSYIDYVLNGGDRPEEVEGNDYLWFNYESGEGPAESESLFREYYLEALSLAGEMEKNDYVNEKYSELEKPHGDIKFEIISKDSEEIGCGPCFMGCVYEIEFYLPESGKTLYLFANEVKTNIIFFRTTVCYRICVWICIRTSNR